MRRAEQPLSFAESLPAAVRPHCWLPTQQVTLTLPDARGEYTAHVIYRCPQTGIEAWNVAAYQREGVS
jgi:hypothetical protein